MVKFFKKGLDCKLESIKILLSHLTHEVRETGDHTFMIDTFWLKSTALYVLNILKLNKLLQCTGTTGIAFAIKNG